MKTTRRTLATVAGIGLAVVAIAQTAPFIDPPFRDQCIVHHYDEGQSPPIDLPDDPLCVEYEKRDITGTNGGAVRFLAAEPARFALAIPKCRYLQQDHWRIQPQPGDPTVGWDGSYWFDKAAGTGGAIARNFTVADQPAQASQVASLVQPVDPDLAAVINSYGDSGGGGGASFPIGFNNSSCLSKRLLNHFECYRLKPPTFVARRGVTLDDQLGPGSVDVKRPLGLCAPADKNDEDPTAPSDADHLVAYKMRQRTPVFARRTSVPVANQFGTFVLDVVKPDLLLVPSAKSLTSTPPAPTAPAVDHFKCYKVARARAHINGVKVDDQFGTLSLDVRKPTRLCIPADKNGEGIQDSAALLLCYRARVHPGTPGFVPPSGPVFTNNQFGTMTARVVKTRDFCVPSLLNPMAPPPTPTPTAPTPTPTVTP